MFTHFSFFSPSRARRKNKKGKLNFLNWFVSRNVTNDERNVRIYTWISIRILLLSSVTFKYMKWQFFDLLLGIYFFTLSCFFCFLTFHIFIIIIIIIVRAYPNHKSVWAAKKAFWWLDSKNIPSFIIGLCPGRSLSSIVYNNFCSIFRDVLLQILINALVVRLVFMSQFIYPSILKHT